MPGIEPKNTQEPESSLVGTTGIVYGLDYSKPSPAEVDLPQVVSSPESRGETLVDDSVLSGRTIYKGIVVTFLNGIHSGEVLQLGTDIVSLSQSQSANWEEKEGQKMRVGINFKNISPRTLSFKLDIYSSKGDVSPMAENVSHLQEVDEDLTQPPYVRIQMGSTAYDFAVCTSYSPEYSLPLPGDGGFRRAVIGLEFKVAGGVGSVYQSAAPFSESTVLRKLSDSKTVEERSKQGSLPAVEVLMSECLSNSENEYLSQALQDEKLEDIDTYLNAPSELFLQLAMSDLPSSVVELPQYQDRLKTELSAAIARNTPSSEVTPVALAKAIRDGTTIPNFPEMQSIIANYNAIYSGVINGTSRTLNQETSSLANKFAKCGRKLNTAGGLKGVAVEQQQNPAFAIANLNKALDGLSTAERRKLLGFGRNISDAEIKSLEEREPFETKESFVEAIKEITGEGGAPAYGALSNVKENDDAILRELNIFLGGADADEIKDRLKVTSAQASSLVGGNYASKEEFSKAYFHIRNPDGEYTFDAGLSDSQRPWEKFADKIGDD